MRGQLWECVICNKLMPFSSKEDHLRGKKHREVLESCKLPTAATATSTPSKTFGKQKPSTSAEEEEEGEEAEGEEEEGSESSSFETTKDQTSVPSDQWQCIICNEWTKVTRIATHLRKKRHRQLAAAVERIAGASTTVAQYEASVLSAFKRNPTSKSSTTKPLKWTCLVCNVRMLHQYTRQHLRGRKHQNLVQAIERAAGASGSTTTKWLCTVCKKEGHMEFLCKENYSQGPKKPIIVFDYSELFQRNSPAPDLCTTGSGNT